MMKIGQGIRNVFCNSGFDEPMFQLFRDDIAYQNSRIVQTTAFLGAAIMSLLTITAIFVPSVSKVLPLYLTTALIFTGIYMLHRTIGQKSGTATLLCNYAFLSAAFFFAIGLDVIQKNATATTICVLLVALPLLVVDKTYREMLFFLMMSICFMYESIYIKQSPKASIDVLNAISFFLVGSFLGYKHNQMVITDIQMPNMDGIALIKSIRANVRFKDMAIIANTQYGDMKQEEQMFALGVDEFVYKAASPRVIQMRVKNVLQIKE